jgi:outer membrane protein TolC
MRVRGPTFGIAAVSVACAALLLPGAPLEARQAQAGPQASDTVPLTLDDALRRAARNNPAFIRTTNDLELNALDRRDRWLDILPAPQVTFLSTNMNWSRQTMAEDLFGEPLPREVVEWVQTSRSSQGFGATMSVNMGNFLQLRQQEEQALGRELAVETVEHSLRADVSRAFLDLQERMEVLELEEALLRTASVNRDLARELYVLALRDRIDLVTLELDLVEQEHALDESRAALETARLGLRNLIGDPDLGEFELVPAELTPFDPAELDVSALLEVARTSSPTVRQAQANLRMEERGVNLVRAQWLPTLTVFASSQRQGFVRGGDAFFDPNPDGGWDGSFGLAVSFPDVGQYFRRRVQRQRTEVAVANSFETLRETRNQLDQDVRSLVNDLRSSARSLEIQERRAGLAAERLELAREAYRLGDESYLELQSAQEQAAQAGRQLLAALYSFERARIELERALGMTTDEMLALGGEG